jgi:glycosyltransferase involved in cell wall biosynthesis
VIAGYGHLSMLSALCLSLWHRKSAILLSESKEDDEPRRWWKEVIKSWLVKKYSSALVGGDIHKRYLIKLGFPEDAIFTGYDIVDNSVFHPDTIKRLSNPLSKHFFLSINRFVEKKNLPLLISAYASYRQQLSENAWDLVLCGDGGLRPALENLINQNQLQNNVHLPGFLQQDELLPYFAHAKCFIHASTTEQWGLVVNEAMAAGLPVIVSNRCGCFEDLVMEGVNGFGFNPENQQELTNLMLKVSSDEVDLKSMGQASLKHIQRYSPDYFAQGLKSAIQYAISKNN